PPPGAMRRLHAPLDRVGRGRASLERPGWSNRPRRARIWPYSGTRTIQEAHDMAGSMTEIPVNGDAVPAYISLPPSGSGPGVVVIQEWWGLAPPIPHRS